MISELTVTLNRTLKKKVVCSFEAEVYRFLDFAFYISVLGSSLVVSATMTSQTPE